MEAIIMKLLGISIFILVFLAIGCENDAKLGDNCTLLKPASEHVTKVEQKNLDCMTLDSDALCISYDGNSSYCTQKCGPKRTCYSETTKKGDVICKSTEKCVDAVCYDIKKTCSPDNLNGLCPEGKKCNESGNCQSICQPNEIYLRGACVLETTKCSPQNVTGACDTGLECSEQGKCEAVGCPENYDCVSPIQLQGHPLKGMYVCVKSTEITSSPCKGITCNYQGNCEVNTDGNAQCNCNQGFKTTEDGKGCEAE